MGEQKIFLSDLHMGAGRPLGSEEYPYEWLTKRMAASCGSFLDYIGRDSNVREIILLGDVLDDNVCPIDRRPPSFKDILDAEKNRDLVNKLQGLARSKELHFVRGNHDIAVTRQQLQAALPGIIVHENGIFEDGGLTALHGHQHLMWCAEDTRPENKFPKLPPGYFLSRIGATKQNRFYTKEFKSLIELVKIIKRTLDENSKSIVELAFKAAWKWAEIGDKEKVVMPDKEYSFDEITANYAGLYDLWRKIHKGEPSVNFLIAGHITAIRWESRDKQGKTLVINGHSHHSSIGKCREKIPTSGPVYADCGAWCTDKPTFVRVDKIADQKKFKVTVEYWNDRLKKTERPGEIRYAETEAVPV